MSENTEEFYALAAKHGLTREQADALKPGQRLGLAAAEIQQDSLEYQAEVYKPIRELEARLRLREERIYGKR